ncbi:MAG TPA: LysM domain-containing protein [Acetobacteraceae bacterium]|nr:LysM domain-containing protein [Acetobacteraceae bacterium]
MLYVVQYGDSLAELAERFLGSPDQWTVIAEANRLSVAYRLQIGQQLFIPSTSPSHDHSAIHVGRSGVRPATGHHGAADEKATDAPGRAFVFVLADEINPLSRKVVRRVAVSLGSSESDVLRQVTQPLAPRSPISIGRHVLGMKPSKFISASERVFGSPRFGGRPYWIDVDKVKAAGGRIIEGEEIARDLDRIARKSQKDPKLLEYIEDIRMKSLQIDRERLIEGEVPLGAVKGPTAMAMTRSLQFVSGVGIAITLYNLGAAANRSIVSHSVLPVAAETARVSGGWAGARVGLEIGGMVGTSVGIESGPGAIVTGAVGSLIFGTAGYFGADWVTKFIVEHEVNGTAGDDKSWHGGGGSFGGGGASGGWSTP